MLEHDPVVERPTAGPIDCPMEPSNDEPIVISNEFADVVIRRVETRNGMRLEISSPRRGTKVHLDAVALDCLSFQPPGLITELLARNPEP